ncbi:MAG: type II secretion system protein GspD [Burkholderiales bacterium PBB4]|nr:MAG: type II secretion system protein GspD [Burkholderiales bacterium PBB4]
MSDPQNKTMKTNLRTSHNDPQDQLSLQQTMALMVILVSICIFGTHNANAQSVIPVAPGKTTEVTAPTSVEKPNSLDVKGEANLGTKQQSNGAALPSPAPSPLSAVPNPGITLTFDNADIYDVLKVVLGDALNLDYAVDPSVQGRITVKSTGAVNLADIFSILETALSTINVSIVKQGSIYKVIKEINSARETLPSTGTGPASPVLQVIPVKFVQASQLANTIRSFIGPQALIANDPTNRYLIVADRASNVAKVIEMVSTLDVDYLQQVSVRLFPLSFADAADIVKDLDALFKTSGIFNWPGTDGTKVYFLPVTRSNAVLVASANEKIMLSAEQWIKTLDAEPKNGLESFVHIYPVVNGNAPHLADLLRQIFGGASSGSNTTRTSSGSGFSQSTASTSPLGPGAGQAASQQSAAAPSTVVTRGNVPSQNSVSGNVPGLGAGVQIIADEITNTIVVRATLQDYKQIKKVLERLDTTAKQVLIQVMVAEVALNDTLQYGVEWWLNDTLKYNGQSFAGRVGLGGLVKSTDAAGVVSGTGGGLTYSVLNTTGQMIGLLNLLGQDTNVNVLSTPHVMASDGKLARIEVGDEVAVVTQTSSTPNALGGSSISNSVTYRPTGIILEVTPVISSSGKVALTVSQEVSNVQPIGSTVGGVTYPNFSKRKVSTEVIVDDGKPLLIAGLIRDSGNNNVSGIPGLKDIPVLGGLFGSTKKIRDKTELIMSITSFIVNNKGDGERITNQFQDSLKELKPVLSNKELPSNKPVKSVAADLLKNY